MKTIGIKLADGSFYPVLEDNTPSEKKLELTTAHNNQTKVMVDLYRSASCSMEDAEYVDSLQIENLVARPNGETDIKFTVSLDEDNKLSAKIVDSETGNESNTTITLVSRTLEERLVTDEYGINDSEEGGSGAGAAIAGGAVAGGLLATAAALRSNKDDDESDESFDNIETPTDTIEETEIPVDETAVDEPVVEEAAEEAGTEISESDDFASEDIASDDIADDGNFDFSEDSIFEADESAANETTTDEPVFDEPAADETLTADEPVADEPVADTAADETVTAEADSFESEPAADVIPDDEMTAPNFDDAFTSETITEANNTEDNSIDDNSLPDMDFDFPDDNSNTTEIENPEMPDDFFNTEDDMKDPTFDSDSPAAAGLNFDGLYDEETERGTPAENEADEVKKKTKVPVIICIICAIICIIATLLILFIIPSKYNLITKKHAMDAANTVAIEKPVEAEEPEPVVEPEPEPPVPQAKEDEIVIIEKAEEVVPQQPPVAEKPKNITYKIKWGDTLWDIADTYYKNPWRYKYIARYNGIKNPDYIISGTKIIIPAE